MAVTDRNIVITPNRTAVGSIQPKIVFTGADSNIGDSAAITLTANAENSGTLSFSGTAGQLFSITNDLSGTIFSVNDVSGIPSLSINDQGIIQLAEFNGRVIIGDSIGSDDSASTLQVSGALTADSASFSKTTITNSGTIGTLSSNVAANAYLKITDGTNTLGFDGNEITQATSGNPGALHFAANQFIFRPGNSGSDNVLKANANSQTELYYNRVKKLETTAYGTTITGTVNADSATIGGNLELVSTDSGASAGPTLSLYRNSASPATNDDIGQIQFFAENNADEKVEYARIEVTNSGVTDGGEYGQMDFMVLHNGGETIPLRLSFNLVQFYRDLYVGVGYKIQFEGDAYNNFETSLNVVAPTQDNTILLPNASGTVLTTGNADTPTTTTSAGDADFILVDDGGTMKKITPANLGIGGGGIDSAATIQLIDSDYVQARSTGTRGTLNNVSSRLFTGDNTTTAFELLNTPADSDDVFVFVNGVLQHTNSYSISGNTVTLDTAPDLGSSIDIRSHLIKSESVSLRDYKKYVYTLGSTVDSVSGADSAGATLTYDAGLVDVYVNGARLVTDKDYTAGNGSQVVFDSALGAGNIVEVVSHSRASVFTPEITSADVSLSTTDSGQNIDSFAKASFRTFKFTAQISHGASNSFHSEEVLLVHNGTNVAMTTFGQVLLDSNLGSFDAFISGANVQIKFSPTKTNTTVKLRGVRTPV